MARRTLSQWLRHLWLDTGDTRRALGAGTLERLQARVAASERQHSGEIRLCVEAALPWRYLRANASARTRAVAMFAKLRVWDTEHNNGVLIYLLVADRAIEIVADRGLSRQVDAAQWQAIVEDMQQEFRQQRFEAGLNAAIEAVDALLRRHFPLDAQAAGWINPNELPDRPVLR